MAQIVFDAVRMRKIYDEFIAKLNLAQAYFLAVLPREQVASTLTKTDEMG